MMECLILMVVVAVAVLLGYPLVRGELRRSQHRLHTLARNTLIAEEETNEGLAMELRELQSQVKQVKSEHRRLLDKH